MPKITGWIERSEWTCSFLVIFILVEMFSGEGQFVVQAVGEKNLIEARTAVFEPG
jgi:hypothetical protein